MSDTPAVETATPSQPAAPPPGSDTPGAEPTSEAPAKPKPTARDRIQDLAAEKRAAIEFADMQKQRADAAEAKLKEMTPAERKDAPKLADFETPEQWAAAFEGHITRHADEAIQSTVDSALQKHGIDAKLAQRDSDFQQSLLTAADKHEDYWEVVSDPLATFMNGALLETVKDLENPGEIVYYLNSHPTEARQIASLGTPAKMGAAIGKLDISTPASPKADVTEAPDPPTPIGAGPAGGVDPAKMTTKDYIGWRVAERAARRKSAS